MVEGDERVDWSAVESVAFLARSEHRFQVLDLLADGARTREGLDDRMDATRVTLSRILSDLEDQEFIQQTHTDSLYELSTFGELVHRDFARLLGTVSVGQKYPKLVSRLPTDWFDFEPQCLVDGEQIHGKSADPLAAARVVANAIKDGSSCRALVGTFTSLPMHAYEEDIRAGGDTDMCVVFDSVVTETMLEDQSLRAKWQAIEDATDSTIYYSLDEQVPCTVDLIDDKRVFLTVDREQEPGFDIISCTHPDVVAWADRVISEYRDLAVPLSRQVSDTR
ncbi:helix-turn-helix transcriptional regulator [Haloarcula argentinensis]|uniref:ArsR family transcriptional regulator n=1 Tax=Haloarcula argentinensis TaxID=43776 RepID=A0A847UKZ1_HALAR|nr:ArsR family transcriptional regulator [Haloarcula argentinensis]NLV11818.1 ArsR family transcriptional regulator [Haloarcula argentinensis]